MALNPKAKAKAFAAMAKALGIAPGGMPGMLAGLGLGAIPPGPPGLGVKAAPPKLGAKVPGKAKVGKGKGAAGKAAKAKAAKGAGKAAALAAAAAAAAAGKAGGGVPAGGGMLGALGLGLGPGGALAPLPGFGGPPLPPPPIAAPPAGAVPGAAGAVPPVLPGLLGIPPAIPPIAPPAVPGMLPVPALPGIPVGGGGPGVFLGGALPVPGKPPAEAWIDVLATAHVLQMHFERDDIYEATTKDAHTLVVNGTWIFVVRESHPADAVGKYLAVTACGASVPYLSAQLGQAFPENNPQYGIVHLCANGVVACVGTAPGRQVFHVDMIRRRAISTVNEPWCRLPLHLRAAAAAGPLAAGSSGGPSSLADKVAELKEKLLVANIHSGKASVEECIAYQLSLKMKKQQAKKMKKSGSDDEAPKKKRKKGADDSDDDSEGAGFGVPSPLESTGNPIMTCASEKPGALYKQAALSAARATGAGGGGEAAAQSFATTGDQWLTYIRTVLAPQFPQGIPPEVLQELRTLAGSLEHLAKGEMGELGDLLVQRLKSLELGLNGNQVAAAAIQLVGLKDKGLTGYRELEMAQRYQKLQQRLAQQAMSLG